MGEVSLYSRQQAQVAPEPGTRKDIGCLEPETRTPEFGTRIPNPGSQIPGPGSRILERETRDSQGDGMFRTRNPNPGTRLPNPGSRIPNPETKNLEAGAERDGGERCHRLRSMLSFVAVLRAYASFLFVSLSALSDFLTVLFVSLTVLSASFLFL